GASARRRRAGRRTHPQSGGVDALLLRDPRRAGADRAARGGGPSLRRRRARGVSPRVGHPRSLRRPRRRPGRGRLPRGADPPRAGACDRRMTDRATRLAEKLPEIGADLLVVTSLVNVRYLTGFTGSNAIAVVGPDTRAFVTDFRYVEQSAAEVDGVFERTISPELLET